MLMPQLIDALNRRNCALIQALERQHKHVDQLNKLTETMSASVVDVTVCSDDAFLFHVAMPPYWSEHIKELGTLLHDYGYGEPQWSVLTGILYSRHHEKNNLLAFEPFTAARCNLA